MAAVVVFFGLEGRAGKSDGSIVDVVSCAAVTGAGRENRGHKSKIKVTMKKKLNFNDACHQNPSFVVSITGSIGLKSD